MDGQTSVKAPKVVTIGDWKGSFEGDTMGFKMQDIISFEEAIVLANGYNEPMASSAKGFNDMEWKKAAGASTYYWGANEGSVASITRIGKIFAISRPTVITSARARSCRFYQGSIMQQCVRYRYRSEGSTLV